MAAEGERLPGPALVGGDVTLVLDGVRVLDGVTLRVEPGTLHCLVGTNGAGKTSLLRCLLGQAPHTGRIARHWPGNAAGVTGYVPQTLDFDRTLPVTTADFLVLAGQTRPAFLGTGPAARGALTRALEAVGLGAKRATALGQLSGGELKRLLLAQALEPRPALLLLDEPMNHLDAPGVALATRLLTGLRDAGATLVCCHHDLAWVRRWADAVTCLEAGRVAASGPPAEVLTTDTILRVFAGTGAKMS